MSFWKKKGCREKPEYDYWKCKDYKENPKCGYWPSLIKSFYGAHSSPKILSNIVSNIVEDIMKYLDEPLPKKVYQNDKFLNFVMRKGNITHICKIARDNDVLYKKILKRIEKNIEKINGLSNSHYKEGEYMSKQYLKKLKLLKEKLQKMKLKQDLQKIEKKCQQLKTSTCPIL